MNMKLHYAMRYLIKQTKSALKTEK